MEQRAYKDTRITTELGRYLYTLRDRRLLEDIAQEVGVSKSTWSRLERGIGHADLPTLITLHQYTNLPYNELMAMVEHDYLRQWETQGCQT